jgi:hypothetical protein
MDLESRHVIFEAGWLAILSTGEEEGRKQVL